MIFTFYSYKGGVGRTHLLANLAAYLCYYKNRKILLIDWDLEAPGLHFYFDKTTQQITSKGLMDLLNKHIEVFKNHEKETLNEDDFFNPLEQTKENYIQNLKNSENGGKIDLMPAIEYNDGYHTEIEEFDWIKAYDQFYIGSYLLWLKEKLKRKYDYVLIDSRTGFNDYSGICNVLMPDMNFILVAPNDQNFEGAKKMMHRIINAEFTQSERRKPFVLPILSRLDDNANFEKADEWRSKFAETFAFVIPKLDDDLKAFTKEILELLSAQTIQPYNSAFSLGEKVYFNENARPLPPSSKLENIENIALNFLEEMNTEGEININKLIGNKMIPKYLRQIKENPDDDEALFQLGLAFYELKNYKEAEKYWLKTVDINPNYYKAWGNLGNLYQNEFKDYEKAKKLYAKVLEINPNDAIAYFNLGNLYAKVFHDYDKSEEAYLKAVEIKPDFHRTWYNLGLLYVHKTNLDKAKKCFNEVLKIKSDSAHTLFNLACVSSLEENKPEVLNYLQKAIELNPESKKYASKDTDFEWLWDDADFLALVQADD